MNSPPRWGTIRHQWPHHWSNLEAPTTTRSSFAIVKRPTDAGEEMTRSPRLLGVIEDALAGLRVHKGRESRVSRLGKRSSHAAVR